MQAGAMRNLNLVAAVMLVLTGCAGRGAAPETITITGALSYRERIALPPDATIGITLSDVSAADAAAPVVAEQTFAAAERQVPVAFLLAVARADLQAKRRYALRGTVRDPQGKLLWTTDAVYPVDPRVPLNDLGVLMMVPVPASSATTATDTAALQARGNEPPWRLKVSANGIELRRGDQAEVVTMPAPKLVPLLNGRAFIAADDSHSLRVVAIEAVCHDSMSGLPYPQTVTLQIDSERLEGCGGQPGELLQGAEWVVEDIDGKGVVDFSRATLSFKEDGQLAGLASCNSYAAVFELTGEGLTIGPARNTRRACAPALNDQEQRFLSILAEVQSFEISETGALILRTPAGQSVTARR